MSKDTRETTGKHANGRASNETRRAGGDEGEEWSTVVIAPLRLPPIGIPESFDAEDVEQWTALNEYLRSLSERVLHLFFRSVFRFGISELAKHEREIGAFYEGFLHWDEQEGWSVDGLVLENGMSADLLKGEVRIQGPLRGLPSHPSFHLPFPDGRRAVIPLAEGDWIEVHMGHEERNEEDEEDEP